MSELLELIQQPPYGGTATLRRALLPMLEGLSRGLGYNRALVALFDEHRSVLRGSVGLNVPEGIAESFEVSLSATSNPLVRALVEGTPQRIDDVLTDPRIPEHGREVLAELGLVSFVVAPLRGEEPAVPRLLRRGRANSPRGRTDVRTGNGPRESTMPAVGVVLLGKETAVTDEDIALLIPFANQAGVALDVDTLRTSSEQHSVEKEWLWWMLSAVDDPVVLTDGQNDIILQNERAEQIFRASAADSEGKRHAISMNNFLFTAALSGWNLDQASARSSRELTLVDPIEGSELLFEVITQPATNYLTGIRGTVAVLKNVTPLRQAAEQLTQNIQRLQAAADEIRLERDRLDLVLGSVPNPILLLDEQNQIVTMTSEAQRFLQPAAGVPVEPRVSQTSSARRDQIAGNNAARLTSFLAQRRLDTHQVTGGELVLIDPRTEDPHEMWVTVNEVRDRLGAVTAVVAVMQGLAPLRELERRRVEQALFQSEKLAATGRLAASIAHEINNPLEAIKNALYLLVRHSSEDDPDRRFLEIARKETERVSRILSQFLGFYRRGGAMRPTDLNALIEEAEGLVDQHLRHQGVRLQNEFATDLPSVVASPDELKQVILNLLLNARDAMPDGGSIQVSTHYTRDAEPEFLQSDSLHVRIRDSGRGIPEDHLPRLFEPFFSTKHQGQGTGLGLWVSFGIVRAHGGNIHVRSRPGQGTTFTVSLPIKGPPDAAG